MSKTQRGRALRSAQRFEYLHQPGTRVDEREVRTVDRSVAECRREFQEPDLGRRQVEHVGQHRDVSVRQMRMPIDEGRERRLCPVEQGDEGGIRPRQSLAEERMDAAIVQQRLGPQVKVVQLQGVASGDCEVILQRRAKHGIDLFDHWRKRCPEIVEVHQSKGTRQAPHAPE